MRRQSRGVAALSQLSSSDRSFCAERYRTDLADNLSLISDENLQQLLPGISTEDARKITKNPRVSSILALIAADCELPLPVINNVENQLLHKAPFETLFRIVATCLELNAQNGVLTGDERKRLAATYGEDLLFALWNEYESLIKPFKDLFKPSVYEADLIRFVQLAKDENALQRGVWSGSVDKPDFSIARQIRCVIAKLDSSLHLNLQASPT